MTEISAGNFTITEATSTEKQDERLVMILWGEAGTFKTTLAATARGNKLWILFDPAGLNSVQGLKNKLDKEKPDLKTALKNKIYTLDMTKEGKSTYVGKFEGGQSDDPFSLGALLADPNLNIQTVVVDSLTTLGDDVLEYSVKYKGYKASTLTNPGQQAYGARLTLMKMFVQSMLKLTAKFNKDIIFISHAKDIYDEEVLAKVSLALGGNVATDISIKFGEIWFVRDSGKGREIFFSPFQKYTPMKTRMFDKSAGKPTSFNWNYDIKNPDPKFEIASMFDTWEQSGYDKIDVPK